MAKRACWSGAITVTPHLKRVSSGITGLDALISGGIPEGTVTLVYGPPKTGKSLFAHHFLAQSIQRGEICHFVVTDYDARGLYSSTRSLGVQEAMLQSNVHVVDMTDILTEEGETEGLGIWGWLSGPIRTSMGPSMPGTRSISASNPLLLIEGLDHVLHTLAERSPRFSAVWDSLTPLFIYNPPLFVAKILREYALRLKRSGTAAALVTYDEGSVDPQSETLLKACVDNVIHLTHNGRIIVEGMRDTPRVDGPYSITATGIKMNTS